MDGENSTLLLQLKDPSKARRVSAANSLGEFERAHASLITPLIDASQDVETEVRVAAVRALVRVWRNLSPIDEYWTQEGEFDRFSEIVSQGLKRSLLDEDKYVRVESAEGLRDLYCIDQEVFDVFVAAAKDEDESLRNRAAIAFWLGTSDQRAEHWQVKTQTGVRVLVDLLQDSSDRVRKHALNAIKSVGLREQVDAPGLTEVLLKLLQDSDAEVRFNAACAVSSSGASQTAALPILLDALSDADRLKRKAAAFALGKMGAKAEPAITALIQALKDTEVKVRTRSAAALGQFGAAVDDVVIYALLDAELDAERNGDRELSLAVTRAFTQIGQQQVEAAQSRASARKARDFFPLFGFKPDEIPFLMRMLQDNDANQRARAVTALGYLAAVEAIPELRRLLEDTDGDVRRRAAEVLKRLGDTAESDS
jgi:HEAT repeat protein